MAMTTVDAVRAVSVITLGDGEVHHEHVHGTRKPELWWIFFGRRWVRLPIDVYVIDHADGVVLFDTGQDESDQVGAVGDAEQLRRTYAAVRAMKEHTPDLAILPAHDPHDAEKLRNSAVPQPS